MGGRLYVGATPPAGAIPGDGWLHSEDLSLAILYDDGTSSQWVVVTGSAGLRGLAGADGTDGTDGADGTDGRNVELQRATTHLQWRLVGDATWLNLVALADLKGDQGDPGNPATATLSIANQTASSSLPGTGTQAIQGWLQAVRNSLRWLTERFDSAGKASEALTADKWAGSAKTVSTSAPSGGVDGDIWFQREA